jgi:hypothetical protein
LEEVPQIEDNFAIFFIVSCDDFILLIGNFDNDADISISAGSITFIVIATLNSKHKDRKGKNLISGSCELPPLLIRKIDDCFAGEFVIERA